jgi:S1-C subfamily serine protease
MTGAVSPLQGLADAVLATARTASVGVLQLRARGARPATVAHVDTDLVVVALHALDRDEGLVVVRDGATLDASVAGRDDALDVALLRVQGLGASPFAAAPGDVAPAQLGVAVARSWPGELMARLATVTGVTCPPRRWRAEPVPSLLRTDLAPGRGVSGGVLVAPDGRLLGWLTTGLSRGGVVAVPAALLADRVARLAAHGRIRRGYVGMAVQSVALPPPQQTHASHGLLVSGLDATGPAATAGILVGDVVLAAADQSLVDPGALQGLLTEARIGATLALRVLRGAEVRDVAVTVGERER